MRFLTERRCRACKHNRVEAWCPVTRDVPRRGDDDVADSHGPQATLAAFRPPVVWYLNRHGRDTGQGEAPLDGTSGPVAVARRGEVYAPCVAHEILDCKWTEIVQECVNQGNKIEWVWWRLNVKCRAAVSQRCP